MVYAAQLRVFVPESAAGSWRVHVPPPVGTRPTAILSDLGLWHGPLANDAHHVEWQGRSWLCPRYPRLRMLEGVLAVRAGHVSAVADVLVPEQIAEAASRELAAIRRRTPDARSFILTSPWHVPLRWFSLFTADDREDYEDSAGYPSVRFRSPIGPSRERLERAIGIIRDAGFAVPIVEALESLRQWLDDFGDEAMVELDYGTVARLFDPADLAADDSVEQVALSLDALERGDLEGAETHYMAVAGRWAIAQALMISS